LDQVRNIKNYIVDSVEEYSNLFDFEDTTWMEGVDDFIEGYFYEIESFANYTPNIKNYDE
jgi:hypothetical protein